MRISKKFVGSNYNGKQIYTRRTGANRLSNEAVKERRIKLCGLEQKFLAKIAPGSARQSGRGAAAASNLPSATPIQPSPAFQANNTSTEATQFGSVLSLQNLTQGDSGSGIDLRNLLNQAGMNQNGNNGGRSNQFSSDLPRTLSMLSASFNGAGNSQMSTSNQSLQNLFQELVRSGSSHGGLNHHTNSTDSLQAFRAMFHEQQDQQTTGSAPKSNSRAAAAGRALLGSLGGVDDHHQSQTTSASSAEPRKDISSFTSAELAAELRKRSSLQDLMATLTGATDSKPAATNNVSATSFQDTLQQAGKVSSADALSSLFRNSSAGMSNLVERQGSIDSLSNLAIRSRFQSIQSSMGSLLDPLIDSSNNGAVAKNNSTWATGAGSSTRGSSGNTLNLGNLKSLAAKVSQESMELRSTNDLIEALGMNHNSLSSLANANDTTSNSGQNWASLINNDDALRRLNSSAPSSLHQNFSPQQFQDIHNAERSSAMTKPASVTTSEANSTAIAQFLLQKQMLEQAGSNTNKNKQHLMSNSRSGTNGESSGSNAGGLDPAVMSSLLSQLRSTGDGQQDEGGIEALKRKFFSEGANAGYQQDEQRKTKPFR